MKAITIKQPWASLVVYGIKDIENRTWPCPKKYIGKRVLIHASKAKAKSLKFQLTDEQIRCVYGHFNGDIPLLIEPKGAIIGSVEIVDCVVNHPSIWAEDRVYNWVLANPIIFENPIENVKGKLSFWEYPGINEVKIECPECGSIELAVEDYTTVPWHTYIHSCNKCGYVIMESEWERVSE